MGFGQRMRNSWTMLTACLQILKAEPGLLLFPLLGFICVALVALIFIAPLFMAMVWNSPSGQDGDSTALFYAALFIFYVATCFTGSFFSVALVATVMRRLAGEDAGVRSGLSFAAGKWRQILGYAVIAATVGVLLRFIAEKAGALGSIGASLAGVAWGLVSFLIIPVLVMRDLGPVEAVKESATLFRRTWGESVVGAASIGFIFLLLHACVFVAGLFFAIRLFASDQAGGGLFVVALMFISWGLLATVQVTLSGIYSAALYRYATSGQGFGPLDSRALAHAFAPKGA